MGVGGSNFGYNIVEASTIPLAMMVLRIQKNNPVDLVGFSFNFA